MLIPAVGERLTANPAVVFALFFPVFLSTQIGQSFLFQAFFLLTACLPLPNLPVSLPIVLQLFSTVATIAAVLLYCLLIERRTLRSLGVCRAGAFTEYTVGLALGLLMFGGAVAFCALGGTLTIQLNTDTPGLGMLVLFFVGFLIQGMSEEMLCRSYLMVSVSRGWPLWSAVTLNALLFALLHTGNEGVSVIALINIFLFGLFASLLTLRRGSIWMVGALHSMWNFAQGNLFGIPVSGIRGIPALLSSNIHEGTWPELINGGVFGLEGGLAVTAILAVACAVVLFVPTKKSEIVENI
jgi:membrane protease YdiL (CAAX protease family)